MTKRLSWRLGASVGVAMAAAFAATPALADSTVQIGNVNLTLGGFIASEGLWRERSEQADIGSTFSGVPFDNSSSAHVSELRFSARQSRLTILVQGDVSDDLRLSFWNELDFLGDAQTGNSNESNSYNPRIRNIYTTADWADEGIEVLAGQNWSLVTLNSHGITPRNEVTPATIDAQYSVGFNWARQPQLRIVKNWSHEFWLAASVENPQTTFAGNAAAASGITVLDGVTGGSLLNKNNTYSLNHLPDVVGKVAWEPVIGDSQPLHMEVFGIYRDLYDRVTTAATNGLGLPASTNNRNTTGGGVGGSVAWSIFPKVLDLQFTGMTGSGIGRYGSGQLPDATIMPNGSLQPINETTMLFGATWHVDPSLDIYTYEGQEAEHAQYYNVGASHLGLGNPAYNLTGCNTEGGACSPNIEAENQANVGFWWKIYQGDAGSFRFGMQYSYTKLTSFAGTGGKPDADDNMVFTSIRYYPF